MNCGNAPYDYEAALAQAPPEHRGAIFTLSSPVFFPDRVRLAEIALHHRAASMFVFREYAEAGGLMSYGPSLPGMFRLAANYVDRIAKSAKPADLPIEQPTKFEFFINLKTAKSLGRAIPAAVLARRRGDRVRQELVMLRLLTAGNGTKRRKPRREFTSAFGGAAEVHGWRASTAFDANDPKQTIPHCSGIERTPDFHDHSRCDPADHPLTSGQPPSKRGRKASSPGMVESTLKLSQSPFDSAGFFTSYK